MAELLEVLVLRMENCEQQQQEVSQLRTQVTKLQQCCQLNLWKKRMECGDMLSEAREDAKTLRQQAPVSTGCVGHYTHLEPLEL